MSPATKNRTRQARLPRELPEERESMVVPRGHAAPDLSPLPESGARFVSVPRRELIMGDAEARSEASEPTHDAKTVMEREEWIRARDQIALVVQSTVAEAIRPLQESIAAIAERLDILVSQPARPPSRPARVPPPPPPSAPARARSTVLPPPLPRMSAPYVPPPMAPSALTRLGDLAGKLRRERGIDVSPMQLAALLLERVATVLDERVAAELAKSSILREPGSSSDDDHSS